MNNHYLQAKDVVIRDYDFLFIEKDPISCLEWLESIKGIKNLHKYKIKTPDGSAIGFLELWNNFLSLDNSVKDVDVDSFVQRRQKEQNVLLDIYRNFDDKSVKEKIINKIAEDITNIDTWKRNKSPLLIVISEWWIKEVIDCLSEKDEQRVDQMATVWLSTVRAKAKNILQNNIRDVERMTSFCLDLMFYKADDEFKTNDKISKFSASQQACCDFLDWSGGEHLKKLKDRMEKQIGKEDAKIFLANELLWWAPLRMGSGFKLSTEESIAVLQDVLSDRVMPYMRELIEDDKKLEACMLILSMDVFLLKNVEDGLINHMELLENVYKLKENGYKELESFNNMDPIERHHSINRFEEFRDKIEKFGLRNMVKIESTKWSSSL